MRLINADTLEAKLKAAIELGKSLHIRSDGVSELEAVLEAVRQAPSVGTEPKETEIGSISRMNQEKMHDRTKGDHKQEG